MTENISKLVYRRYSTPYLKALELNNRYCFIYLKKLDKYYYKSEPFDVESIEKYEVEDVHISLLDLFMYCLLICSPITMFILIQKLICSILNIDIIEVFFSFLFLIVNVIVHEFSHYFYLRLCKEDVKCPRIKIENGIIKFFVNTSSSYLLPPYKRFIVYFIGIIVNIYMCFIFVFVIHISPNIIVFTMLLVVINIIPSTVSNNDMMQIIKLASEIKKRYKS